MTWMTPNHHKSLSEPAMSSVFARRMVVQQLARDRPSIFRRMILVGTAPEVARTLCTSTSPAPNFLGSLQNPSLLVACHARASDWYAAHGLLGEAVEHAISIPDDERVAAILERDGWRMIAAMESRQVSAWANRIAEPTLFRKLPPASRRAPSRLPAASFP